MKYSFFSSACTWFPSALMMAVSASGASSAPLASCVRYVPADIQSQRKFIHLSIYIYSRWEHCNSRQLEWPILPLCLARYRPRAIIKHKVMKTTTATMPPIKAWSGPCCPRALGSERRQSGETWKEKWIDNVSTCKMLHFRLMQL